MALVEAHEGHQPLPTKGVQVDIQRGQLTLSAQACNAIGLQTEEVKVGTVSSSLKVYAESVTPWQSKAYGSAQISGRIAKLLVRPGDFVEKDQVVAELSSRELESVKLDYLQATKDLELNQRLLAMTRPSAQAGAVPMQRLLDIENAIQQSQNRLEVARIRAQTLGVRLDISALNASDALHYQIRSPLQDKFFILISQRVNMLTRLSICSRSSIPMKFGYGFSFWRRISSTPTSGIALLSNSKAPTSRPKRLSIGWMRASIPEVK